VTDDALALALRAGLPFVGLRDHEPDPGLDRLIPPDAARAARVVPLAAGEDHLRLAVADPEADITALAPYIRDLRVELAVADRDEVEAILGPPKPAATPTPSDDKASEPEVPDSEREMTEPGPAALEIVEPEVAEPEVADSERAMTEPEPAPPQVTRPEPEPAERDERSLADAPPTDPLAAGPPAAASEHDVPDDEVPSWLEPPRRRRKIVVALLLVVLVLIVAGGAVAVYLLLTA
jgi:Type II secretion system (T2SS), protein E, N-terminal domain